MATTDLSYLPSEADLTRFWEETYKTNTNHGWGLPPGYPRRLASSLAWKAQEIMERRSDWFLNLTQEDIQAIDVALAAFEARYDDVSQHLSEVSAETFTLPSYLVQKLRQVSDQCYNGFGFRVIRGLDPSKHSPTQNLLIYAGVAAHVAPQRGFVDIHHRAVISHIVNVICEDTQLEAKAPPGFSTSALSFHTDNCEILGLYCLEAATKGGSLLLASSWNLYNDLAMSRPDILKTLTEEWILDTFRDYTIAPPRHRQPCQLIGPDKIAMRFNRYGITGWRKTRHPDLPPPTLSQIEAMNAVQSLAAANSIRLDMMKGDILFLNDMSILHGRTAFKEAGIHKKRHLLKMLLRDPAQDWAVSDSFKTDWLKVYGPNRTDGSRVEEWSTQYYPGSELEGLDNG